MAVAAGLCLQTATAHGSSEYSLQAGGKSHDFLYSISVEEGKGIAVGDHGLIQASNDSGKSWIKLESPAKGLGLLSVVRKGGRCLASGIQGTLIRSDDCIAWKSVKPVTDARLLAIHANSKGEAVAVGSFGTVIRSVDWGKTWTQIPIAWRDLLGKDVEPHLYSVRVSDEGAIVLGGEFELIVRSIDGGQSWSLLHKGEKSIFGLSIEAKGRLFAVGQEGLILRSNDLGKTWKNVDSATAAVLTDVWASNEKDFVAVVGMRTVLTSVDGGTSFQSGNTDVSKTSAFSTVTGIDDQKDGPAILVGGSSGVILRKAF